jgi:hypothetical protein
MTDSIDVEEELGRLRELFYGKRNRSPDALFSVYGIALRSLAALQDCRDENSKLRERGTAVSDNCVTGNQREMECPQPTLTDEERT